MNTYIELVGFIPTRHVFTRKDTGITKCRIVVRGDLQPKDDDKQHSSPVAHAESFRILCTIAASTDMELDSVDVNQAFLLADIKMYINNLTDS